MRKEATKSYILRVSLLILLVLTQDVFAGKSQKWKNRFITSTQDGVVATEATLPSDKLTCTDGVVKLNRNMEATTDSTDVVWLTFPLAKNGATPTVKKCSPYSFYKGSTGEVMNSGNVTASCVDGHFQVTANCKMQGNETCPITNGTGVQYFDPATDALGACTVTACNSGYSIFQNGCIVSQVACSIANGTGYQYFNGSPYTGCTLASCNSGYTASGNTCVAVPVATEKCGISSANAKIVYSSQALNSVQVNTFWTDNSVQYYNYYGGSDSRLCSLPSGCVLKKYTGGDVSIDHWYYCEDQGTPVMFTDGGGGDGA